VILTEEFQEKVKFLCSNIPHVEWSGILFYKIEGQLNEENVAIVPMDILPMDKGSSSFTQFESDERIAEFYQDKRKESGKEIYTWKRGLIHSHNNMSVFFSGTDNDELISEAKDFSQYFSLICNNKLEFCAKVAQSGEATVKEEKVDVIGQDTSKKRTKIGETTVEHTEYIVNVFETEIEQREVSFSKDTVFHKFTQRVIDQKPPKSNTGNKSRAYDHSSRGWSGLNSSDSWGDWVDLDEEPFLMGGYGQKNQTKRSTYDEDEVLEVLLDTLLKSRFLSSDTQSFILDCPDVHTLFKCLDYTERVSKKQYSFQELINDTLANIINKEFNSIKRTKDQEDYKDFCSALGDLIESYIRDVGLDQDSLSYYFLMIVDNERTGSNGNKITKKNKKENNKIKRHGVKRL